MVPIRTLLSVLAIASAAACAKKSNAPPPTAPLAEPSATEPEPAEPEPDEPGDADPDAPEEPDAPEGEVAVIVIDDVGPAPMVMAPPPRPEPGSMIADILTGPRPR